MIRCCGVCGGEIPESDNAAFFDLPDGHVYYTHVRCAHPKARIVAPVSWFVKLWRMLWVKQS